jgi:uridine kinase
MSEIQQDAGRRGTIQVGLPDGRYFSAPRGTTIEQVFMAAYTAVDTPNQFDFIAAIKNDRLRELSHPLHEDATLAPLPSHTADGARIYRRSLSFLLIVAASKLFPDWVIRIEHSMPFGGFYCEVDHKSTHQPQPITPDQLAQLVAQMQALVAADLPINQVQLPLAQALALFQASGDPEKAELFAKRRKDYLTLYELNGVRDYFHGFMVPRTGYLTHFALHPYHEGFILQFPRRQAPTELQPFEDEPRLVEVFHNYNHWLSIMGLPTVCALNRAHEEGRMREVILVAEALHEKQLADIATAIATRANPVRVVLISGPTSAGKTTFSKRLALQLLAHGRRPLTIAMDNYFVNREDTPLDEDGELDFEAFEAVDVALFNEHLQKLLAGERIQQPRFNFHTGQREWGEWLQITPNHLLLIEGIHGLNPSLTLDLPPESLYRVFVNAFTQLNLDKHNRVPTTESRLLRRIVRDAAHRGYGAAETIARWESVRRGEKRHIYTYQNEADVFFNSALIYEVAALKRLAEPLLRQVEPGTPERMEANRLLAFLQWFEPLAEEDTAVITSVSILREFIGGSILNDYEPH